jgi:hypothetical protein
MVLNVDEAHQRITSEITESREKEMREFVAQKQEQQKAAEGHRKKALEDRRKAGIDVDKLEASHAEFEKARKQELDTIRKQYAGKEDEPKVLRPDDQRRAAFEVALSPEGAAQLPPAWAAVFSTKDAEDKLSGGTGTDVFNYNIIDAWAWASGGGNGWFGSGAGSYQVWVEWGYWFIPPTSRFYGITTHDQFRGYYIVRSFDDWWISAYSRAVVSMWTDVWQYNWKGLSGVNVLDIGADNIDVNQRFDTDRAFYSSALLGGGDWAYIRSVVGLYVYARAGGSYSELNFATGSANYLAAPYVSIS